MKALAKIKGCFLSVPGRVSAWGRGLWERTRNKCIGTVESLKDFFAQADYHVYMSMGLMGLGQLAYGQITKGLGYLLIEIAFIAFMVLIGSEWVYGLFTLGEVAADPWGGVEGDNSVLFMLFGILAVMIIVFFVAVYLANIRGVAKTHLEAQKGMKPASFADDMKSFAGPNYPKLALFFPIAGVLIFSVLPIAMMILVAFTNYGGTIIPPTYLVDWVGFSNFQTIFGATNIGSTFFKILGWNILWAIMSTFLNYFLGLGLALLLSKKVVKGKAIWRAFPILAYAIPGFITLLGFKFMFSTSGPINYYLSQGHMYDENIVDFLGLDAKWSARMIGLLVNAWLSVPTTMLLATGILSNVQTELYEAADIDGASKTRQFFDITLPYVIFATTPTLISQFVSNFNNFGTFYFLRGGLYIDGYFLSSDTDLLINWLYNLSISRNHYSIGAAISLLIFIITSAISLLVYVRSSSYKKEDTYR